MENKRVVPVWVSLVLLVLCGVAFALNLNAFSGAAPSVFECLIVAFQMLSAILAVCYCFAGYEKASAFLFKAVIFTRIIALAFAVALLVQTSGLFTSAVTLTALFGDLIIFGFLFVFGVALDIGKKRSIGMAYTILAVSVILFVVFLITDGAGSIGVGLVNILLSVIFLIMVLAKYRDKASRGRA